MEEKVLFRQVILQLFRKRFIICGLVVGICRKVFNAVLTAGINIVLIMRLFDGTSQIIMWKNVSIRNKHIIIKNMVLFLIMPGLIFCIIMEAFIWIQMLSWLEIWITCFIRKLFAAWKSGR